MAAKKKGFPEPTPTDDLDVAALKALATGTASAGQQLRALRFILNATGVREMNVDFENPNVTYFYQGMRFVGWQIAKLIELVGVTPAAATKET